eukprot:gene11140-biopygen13906
MGAPLPPGGSVASTRSTACIRPGRRGGRPPRPGRSGVPTRRASYTASPCTWSPMTKITPCNDLHCCKRSTGVLQARFSCVCVADLPAREIK